MKEFFSALWEYIKVNSEKIITVLCVLIFGYIIIKIFLVILSKSFKRKKVDTAAADFIITLFKVSLFIIYIISLLALLGVPTTSMIAVLSAAGLAVSLALQNSLSNLASGIIIIFNKPFIAGDYVDIGAQGGTVEHITMFNTCLVTPDGKQVYIPNSIVTTSNIINYSQKPIRRIDISLPIAYGSDIAVVKEALLNASLKTPLVFNEPMPSVMLTGVDRGALLVNVRVWVSNADYWTVIYDLNEKCVEALVKSGIEIPLTRHDVRLHGSDGEKNGK